MKSDFLIALTQLAAERHLPREQVLGAIEVALASAFKKDNPASGQNISVTLNPNTGDVSVYALKTVVESVEDPDREITLADAKHIKKSADIGDEVRRGQVLAELAERGGDPEAIVDRLGVRQVGERDALLPYVDRVLSAWSGKVEEYRAGKQGLLGFFVGQVVRESGGGADPRVVKKILEERLE